MTIFFNGLPLFAPGRFDRSSRFGNSYNPNPEPGDTLFFRRVLREKAFKGPKSLGSPFVRAVIAIVVAGGIKVATFTVAAIPFGGVGLSRGVTMQIGQSDQAVLMMLDRIGPIALGDFLLVPRNRTTHYPRGRIYLG